VRRKSLTVGPFRRSGLHKLECDCGGYVYATVAQLELRGLPCCGCGERFVPERLELAELLGLMDAPAVAEYRRELSGVLHGQASHGRRGRELRPAELVAAERVERRRRELARKRRLTAILPVPEPMPF
jgi:hypothetical protein